MLIYNGVGPLNFERTEENINELDYAKRIRKIENRLNYERLDINEKQQLLKTLDTYYFELESITNPKDAMREYLNHVKRTTRASNRIELLISNYETLFLTLTFKSETLESTTEETRRLYVARFLKSVSPHYVANIDYGKQNGREHYHAIVVGTDIDYSKWHKFGAIKGVKIRKGSNPLQLSKYINKLSLHACKSTTRGKKLIYSRLNDLQNDLAMIQLYRLVRDGSPSTNSNDKGQE